MSTSNAFGRRVGCVQRQGGGRLQGQVQVFHIQAGVRGLLPFDDLARQAARDGILAGDAGIDVQQFHDGSRSDDR